MNFLSPFRFPVPGTRPVGARNEDEAARQVREMFSRIAPRYDFLNHLLSLRCDVFWRRRVAERFRDILERADARVLDLCCGTGDLTFALGRIGSAGVFGSDFAHPMLVRAQGKVFASQGFSPDTFGSQRKRTSATEKVRASPPVFLEGDALALPFADASFDLATSAFGLRNLANYERGLREIHRVLRPGGEAGILEFSEPRGAVFGTLFRFYFTRVLPWLGGTISGSAAAYAYLPRSVAKFPRPEELAELMWRVGFADVGFERWTGGIVALHSARRPPR